MFAPPLNFFPPVRTTLIVLCLSLPSFAQYQLHSADASVLIGASQSCLDAYNANVSCTSSIGYLYTDRFPDLCSDTLTSLCTTDCFNSLVAHRNNVASTCGPSVQYYNDADESYWPATYLDDVAIYSYNLTCMERRYNYVFPKLIAGSYIDVNRTGQYCNTWFQMSRNNSSTSECDECYMKTVYIQASSPAESDAEDMRSIYVSMSATCSYNGPPASTVASLLISS